MCQYHRVALDGHELHILSSVLYLKYIGHETVSRLAGHVDQPIRVIWIMMHTASRAMMVYSLSNSSGQ